MNVFYEHDYEIYFLCFRVECDIDGWTLRVNNEDSYETFYHLEGLAIEDIVSVEILGDALISYTGFGDKGQIFIYFVHDLR